MSIDNNDATCFVEDKLYGYDFENIEFPGKEDMEKLREGMEDCDYVSTFLQYTLVHALRCGYSEDRQDIGKIASFLAEECKKESADISRQTLKNWLKGFPASTASGRENIYRLCFALRMNAEQTKEFFLKAYLERPFNYKNINEAVYFFCLNNGHTYSDAQRIIAVIESSQMQENPQADDITEKIGEELSKITTEEGLLRYIINNRSGFGIQNKSATEKIKELVKNCKELAPKEYEISFPHYKAIAVNNIDELLNVIYGYAARAIENDQLVHKKSISKSSFPDLIKRNWPQREQFAQILEKKTASYDVIRRALIMLNFYHFFASAINAEKKAQEDWRKTGKVAETRCVENGLFDEFTDEMNGVLAACGYVQLYWRNPFDWMIGYCAMAPNPLRTLRDLIEEYYLSDPAVIDQIVE